MARTLAEVTAKVGAAAKGLAKEEKASRNVRKLLARADAVLEKTRSRKIKMMSEKRRSSVGRVVKKDRYMSPK